MKINAASLLSFSAIFGACLYAASAHAEMDPSTMPPKEAIEACGGKAENDTCSFTGRENQALNGTCHKGPDGNGVLACVPVGHNMGGKPGDAGTQQPAQ